MKRAGLILLLALAGPLCAQKLTDCQTLERHGQRIQARRCFAGFVNSADPYLRAEGFWGIGDHKSANSQFEAALKAKPKSADIRVRWGRLFLDRFNADEAVKLFQEALEIEAEHAGAVTGMALAASERFDRRAVELAERAVKSDPKLLEARELLARLALEETDEKKAIEEADRALGLSTEALNALAVRGTIELLNGRPAEDWFSRILKINPVYGEGYALAARLHVLNRRYEEGIKLYRRALELDADLWNARSELGVQLMRLGEEVEARKHLELCYENNYRDAATVNTLRLMDSYKNFVTFKTDRTIVRLHKKEAELLRPYLESELLRAITTYEKKYALKLNRPVQLEVYPDHEDFAVRTLGMPGLGALGVTFGYVVAMDSPSGRRPGTFHWASTLWHELSHVFVLAATNHRVPRWFTEGMAVHEETAVDPEWGDRLDPEVIDALAKKRLLPIAQLDRGFIRPQYPAQVVVSYFQAGRICDYIAGKWGYSKLLEMMHAFASGRSTPQVIEEQLKLKPEDLDGEFLAWLDKQTGKTVSGFAEWRKGLRALSESNKEKKYDDVLRDGPALRDIYPDYVEAGSAYEFLAEAHSAKNDKAAAARELARWARAGGRSPMLLKKLATWQEELGQKKEAAATLDRINYIYPVADEELHRRLGDLWLGESNLEGAIREYSAVVALKPIDTAGSHYRLAKAYELAQRLDEAQDQLLQALEAAPSYKPAQKMLLELSERKKR